MEKIFNEQTKQEILGKLNAILSYLKVDYLLCRSNYIDAGNVSYAALEEQFEKDKRFKVDINNVYFASEKQNNDDGDFYNWYDTHQMTEMWNRDKVVVLDEIETLAKQAENKYELNSFLSSLFEQLDMHTESYNFNSWIRDKDPANVIKGTQLWIEGGYKALCFIYFNFDFVKFLIQQEFAMRANILWELKYWLVTIYSRHLVLPSIKELPTTTFEVNKIDIFEVLVFIERFCKLEDFEKFKAIYLQMLGLKIGEYPKLRSKISERKRTFSFIKKMLIQAKEVDE